MRAIPATRGGEQGDREDGAAAVPGDLSGLLARENSS